MRGSGTKEFKGLVRERDGEVWVYVRGKWIHGGKDDRGAFFYTTCASCGDSVKRYIGKFGPKRLKCNSCSKR